MQDFEVSIEPTAHSRHEGHDLTIRQHGWGWAKSDLTDEELGAVRDAIDKFLAEKDEAGETGSDTPSDNSDDYYPYLDPQPDAQ